MKLEILSPKKKDILIYRVSNFQIFNEYNIVDASKVLNIFILIKSFLYPKTSSKYLNYTIEYINLCKPKYVITFIDNDSRFYLLKEKFKDIIFISIQNGHRSIIDDFFSIKEYKNLQCDYMFLFNKYILREYNKTIKSKKKVIGSFKNNNVKIIKYKRNRIIGFISQYSEKGNQVYYKKKDIKILWKDHFEAERVIVKILSEYCYNQNYKLMIILRSNLKSEKKFYKDLIFNKCNWNFSRRSSPYDGYKILDECSYVFGVDGTLLYESFSRGKRTGAISIRSTILQKRFKVNMKGHRYCWPYETTENGPFWTHTNNKKQILKVIKNVVKMSNYDWIRLQKKYSQLMMKFDYQNKSLFKELKLIMKR